MNICNSCHEIIKEGELTIGDWSGQFEIHLTCEQKQTAGEYAPVISTQEKELVYG